MSNSFNVIQIAALFFSINVTKIHYTKKKNWLKAYRLQLIPDSKNCYEVWHMQIIIKILKNVTNIVELVEQIVALAVKVEKSNCKLLHSKSKQIKIKHILLDSGG